MNAWPAEGIITMISSISFIRNRNDMEAKYSLGS